MPLRLLLFSDLHANLAAAGRLIDLAQQADVLVGAGDFATARRNLQPCITALRAADRPTVLVAGNNETTAELVAACKGWSTATVLHGTSVTLAGQTFFGLGGGVPITPFGPWSYDLSEEQAAQLLQPCPAGCVLISHSPPYGVVDRSSAGRSLGSQSVRRAVLELQPRLVVCGHIHASAGQQAVLGASPVVNAGPRGLLWELE